MAFGVENGRKSPFAPREGQIVLLSELPQMMSRLLREEFWCRLEGPEAFLHFGWDYYLYVGVATFCPTAILLTHQLGLFVEAFTSPYHPQPEE
jgi:hypothetical protein